MLRARQKEREGRGWRRRADKATELGDSGGEATKARMASAERMRKGTAAARRARARTAEARRPAGEVEGLEEPRARQ